MLDRPPPPVSDPTELFILQGRVNLALSLIRHRRLACGDLCSRDVTVLLRALEGRDVIAEAAN